MPPARCQNLCRLYRAIYLCRMPALHTNKEGCVIYYINLVQHLNSICSGKGRICLGEYISYGLWGGHARWRHMKPGSLIWQGCVQPCCRVWQDTTIYMPNWTAQGKTKSWRAGSRRVHAVAPCTVCCSKKNNAPKQQEKPQACRQTVWVQNICTQLASMIGDIREMEQNRGKGKAPYSSVEAGRRERQKAAIWENTATTRISPGNTDYIIPTGGGSVVKL